MLACTPSLLIILTFSLLIRMQELSQYDVVAILKVFILQRLRHMLNYEAGKTAALNKTHSRFVGDGRPPPMRLY